jgi:membrane protein DedA with SNARE-associated domain
VIFLLAFVSILKRLVLFIMPEGVVLFITKYGYLAIFVLILVQEIGVPNPVPVELLLFFTGYLSFKGLLFLPFVIITGITADFIGANILYFIFYYSGTFLIQKKPKWVFISDKKITAFKEKITSGGIFNIYLFRLLSLTRGYTSIAVGLLGIKPRIYFPVIIISAFSWTVIWAILGFIFGPSWNSIFKNIDFFKFLMLGILLIIISIFIFIWLRKKRIIQKKNKADINSY